MEYQEEIHGDKKFVGNVEILGSLNSKDISVLRNKINQSRSESQTVKASFTKFYETIITDGIADVAEKRVLLQKWNEIEAEYPIIRQRALDRGISELDEQMVDYANAYTALNTYLFGASGILDDMTVETTIVPAEMDLAFSTYYTERETVLSLTFTKSEENTVDEALETTPRFRGSFLYVDDAGADTYYSTAVPGDWVLLFSNTQIERGIYAWSSVSWIRQDTPTSEQIGSCFMDIIKAVYDGYGESSDYVPASGAFEVLLVKFLYVLKMRLELTGAIFSGGYNEYGDNDGTPGAFISGLGDFKGRGAYFKDITSETLKTLISYAGAWVYGSWGSEATSVSDAVISIELGYFSDGRILCLYAQSGTATVYETIRGTNGAWSTPVLLSGYRKIVSVLVLEDDSAIAVVDTASVEGLVVVRSISGSWSNTSDSLGYTFDGTLVLLNDYRVLYVYTNGTKIYEKVRSTGGTWGSDTAVRTVDGYYSYLTASKLPDGSVLLVYELSNVLYEMVRSAAGSWSGPSSFFSPGSNIGDCSVLALPDGTALCSVSYGATFTTYLHTLTRSIGGSWTYESQRTSALTTVNALSLLSNGSILLAYRRAAGGYIYSQLNSAKYSAIPVGAFQTEVGAGVIEVGENSSGVYIKFGDGLLICYQNVIDATRTLTAGTVNGYAMACVSFNWTFPLSFSAQPACFASGDVNWGPGVEFHSLFSRGSAVAATAEVNIMSTSTLTLAVTSHLMAIGRWK